MIDRSSINEQLMIAVEDFDLARVAECLKQGADPSYMQYPDSEEPSGLIQPTTPLRMVMFRISDNFLNDDDLIIYGKIAKLLMQHGADPTPAMFIAQERYGKYDPNMGSSPFLDVWHIIAGNK